MDVYSLQSLCIARFGQRDMPGVQNQTTAVGMRGALIYSAKQSSPVDDYQVLVPTERGFLIRQQIDARKKTVTKRPLSERGCYHAEMIVVSAWVNDILGVSDSRFLRVANYDSLRDRFRAESASRPLMIAANADVCFHCGNLLRDLGILFPNVGYPKKGLTGWWNPLTDNVIPNADTAFQTQEIPKASLDNRW